MFVARRRPSMADWPVPYWLSNMCFVRASFTAMIGYASTPSAAIARRRMTRVDRAPAPPYALADAGEDGHLAAGPLDAPRAGIGERTVGHVRLRLGGDGHDVLPKRFLVSRSQTARRTAGPSMNGPCTSNPRRRYTLAAGRLSWRTLRTTS